MAAVLLLLCLGAALLSAGLVRAMIGLAVLDMPGHRSAHHLPTPKGGGVGVLGAFVAGMAIACWWWTATPHALPGRTASCLVAAACGLGLVSWLDDVRQFPPLVKLLAQAAAAALLLWGIGRLPGYQPIVIAVGFGWLLFVTNAINFIDGLNGLAAGSMALACLGIALALGGASTLLHVASCLLAAGLAGFLPFNYPRARIFLGDVGSQGAGMTMAAFGLLRWQEATPAAGFVVPLLLLGILYDVGFTLCRRLLAGDRLFQAHRGHLYQLAFRAGAPAPALAALHWGFVLWGGAIALALLRAVVSWPSAAALALLPQIVWTLVVLRAGRRGVLGEW